LVSFRPQDQAEAPILGEYSMISGAAIMERAYNRGILQQGEANETPSVTINWTGAPLCGRTR